MLKAIDLVKKFGHRTALDGLNLTVEPGEVYCLLGGNGAGKTTTLSLFMNFIAPTSGTASVGDRDVTRHTKETRHLLGFIPEQVALYGELTGLENLEYFARLSQDRWPKRPELRDYLRQVGLPEEAFDRHASTYSKGMRQKVAIAVALTKRARALLLDEPTSGLDPQAANEFSKLIQGLSQTGVAILMATHDLFRAKEAGTRIGIMKHGRLVASLRTDEIGQAGLESLYLQHMHD